MQVSDFYFDLPNELIARYPQPERTSSRLLMLDGDSGALRHQHFSDLPEFVQPGDLLIFNNTRVVPARIYAHKSTGGKVEILIERMLTQRQALAHVRASKSPKPGSQLLLSDDTSINVVERQDALFLLELNNEQDWLSVMNRLGHMPLPPYIDRPDETADKERYQTVYAEKPGAVAAPTAGLHFDQALLDTLRQQGIETEFVTLHVGAGTFQPVREKTVEKHHMHSEWIDVSQRVVDAVERTRARGGRVIAVGTTSVRSLESAARFAQQQHQSLAPYQGETNIFIYPGYSFRIVDAMITNFHLPESTLIMLVSAFAGFEHVMHAYQTAVAERYRFFSYGDAMFITRNHSL